MDIIDIILARAKSFTGETATLTQQAQAAMADANNIIDRLEAIQSDTQDANETAIAAAQAATAAAEEFDQMQEDIEVATAILVDSHISEALSSTVSNITVTDNNNSKAKIKQINITKNGETNTYTVEKNYTSYGDNEDGSMTQKAIKNYIQQQISNIPTSGASGGNTNLGQENAGSVVVVGNDGNITAGNTSELELIELLIRNGVYQAIDGLGLDIDYENKTVNRTQGSTDNTNFNNYVMYKRVRCNVNDNGEITAFYGNNNYREDGSNGQVMVYQPKFYYQRIPINTTNGRFGEVIRKESLIISPTKQSGFKLHPAFINENGDEIDYILLSAYEGCVYDVSESRYLTEDNSGIDFSQDKLSSIAGVKPVSGEKNTLKINNAERLATNRGEGWHISTMQTYNVDQMLTIVEYGSLNIQSAFENGVSNLENSYNYNRANQTGSTSSLGNYTGAATSSTNTTHGVTNNYDEAGKRSISYRGEENPYGNIWKFIGNVNISGDGNLNGGIPYICKNFNYNHNSITEDYESVGFCLPNNSDWISGMGYGNTKYDWVFLPAEASNANSATPVGDSIWTTSNLNGINVISVGGTWLFSQKNGLFYYACDKNSDNFAAPFSARLVYIPRKNTIHNNNVALWQLAGDSYEVVQ